jgi:hypothetical protein
MSEIFDVPGVGRIRRRQHEVKGHQGDRIVRSSEGSFVHENGAPLSAIDLRKVMKFIENAR